MNIEQERIGIKSTGSYETWWKIECECGKTFRVKPRCGATRCPWCDKFVNIAKEIKEEENE